jgi:hypothetical protein
VPRRATRRAGELGDLVPPGWEAAGRSCRPTSVVQLPAGGQFVLEKAHAVLVDGDHTCLVRGSLLRFKAQDGRWNAQETDE